MLERSYSMGSKVFNQILLIVAVVMLVTMFFFPNVKQVKNIDLQLLTFLFVIGLYIKDWLKG